MEQKSFKKQAWIGVAVIAGSLIVFAAIFYVLVGQIQATADAITKNRGIIANESALINSYSDLKRDVGSATTYQAAMDRLLGTQDDLIAFPSQIDGIARNEGVEATFSFKGDPVPPGTNTVGYVDFTLNITGSLDNIVAFMKDVESSAPILLSKIDSFDLTQSGPSYVIAVTGRVFFK